MRVVRELPGSNCTAGGYAILTGLDASGDGALDDAEVSTVSYACDGLSGAPGSITDASGALNVKMAPYSAVCDGDADDTAAFVAARAEGRPLLIPAGATCVVSKQVITADTTIVGAGRYSSTLKLKSGTNDHLLYVKGDHRLVLRDLGLDGNFENNPNLSLNYQVGVLVPVGSLDMKRCYVHGFKGPAVEVGNVDYDFDPALFAHDLAIEDNEIDQSTATQVGGGCSFVNSTVAWANTPGCLGDQLRIYRTRRGRIANNFGMGGLSGFRSNYYCDHLTFAANTVTGSYGDAGITAALSTDIVIDGNVLTDHGGNGVEVDSVWRAVVSNNVMTGNGLTGLMMANYGPPTASASYQGVMYDAGLPVEIGYVTGPLSAQNYTSKDVTVVGNTMSQNWRQGAMFIGQAGPVLFSGNSVSDNDLEGAAYGNTAGVYIDGGVLNADGIFLAGNTFDNIRNQLGSVQQANVNFQTVSGGNRHVGGTFEYTAATRGTRNLNPDPTLYQSTYVFVTPGSVVADVTSPTGYARQIVDANATGNVSMQVRLPVPAFGAKLAFVRFRSPDALGRVEIVANLFAGSTFKYTAFDSIKTNVGADWSEVAIPLPASLSAYAYDTVRLEFVTGGSDLTRMGSLNVQEVSVFTTADY